MAAKNAVAGGRQRRGCGCFGTGCLTLLGLLVVIAALGGLIYFQVPQRLGLLKPAAQRMLAATPERAAAADLTADTGRAGFGTTGVGVYVLPYKSQAGSLAYVVLDGSQNFSFPSSSHDPIVDCFKALADSPNTKKYGIQQIAMEYKDPTGATLLQLTAPTATISGYANGSVSRQDLLKAITGQVNWPAFVKATSGY